jgi:hypothetical protein
MTMPANSSSNKHDLWPSWAAFLRCYRLENIAAWLIESSGPWALICAQLVYIGQPLLQPFVSNDRMEALAVLLEDRDEGQAFIACLYEETA